MSRTSKIKVEGDFAAALAGDRRMIAAARVMKRKAENGEASGTYFGHSKKSREDLPDRRLTGVPRRVLGHPLIKRAHQARLNAEHQPRCAFRSGTTLL